jgi:hypothetical protein
MNNQFHQPNLLRYYAFRYNELAIVLSLVSFRDCCFVLSFVCDYLITHPSDLIQMPKLNSSSRMMTRKQNQTLLEEMQAEAK